MAVEDEEVAGAGGQGAGEDMEVDESEGPAVSAELLKLAELLRVDTSSGR
jgi:hypothetical protein